MKLRFLGSPFRWLCLWYSYPCTSQPKTHSRLPLARSPFTVNVRKLREVKDLAEQPRARDCPLCALLYLTVLCCALLPPWLPEKLCSILLIYTPCSKVCLACTEQETRLRRASFKVRIYFKRKRLNLPPDLCFHMH